MKLQISIPDSDGRSSNVLYIAIPLQKQEAVYLKRNNKHHYILLVHDCIVSYPYIVLDY